MTAPVKRSVRRRGWLALAVSLALHAGLVGALTRLPGRAQPGPGAESGPVVLHLLAEEAEEGNTFLVPQSGRRGVPGAQVAKPAENPAAPEVAVHQHAESIIPVTHQTAPSFAAGGVDPALVTQASGPSPGPGIGHANDSGGMGGIFAVGAQARSVVYVIDRSASMGPGGLLAGAVRELCASLARLPPATRIQVIVYHDQPELLLTTRPALVAASPGNVEHAARLLSALRAEGGTNHFQALRLAVSLTPEAIYLLTDADDLSDADRREVTRINHGRAVIHTIELNTSNRDRTDMPLQVLARENRGRYQAVELQKAGGIRKAEGGRRKAEERQ